MFSNTELVAKYVHGTVWTEEEIYDDGSSVAPSPLSNLKSKFEQNSFPNPAPKPKPASKPFQKLGGGGYLQGVVGKDNIPNGSIENSSKDDKGSESGTGKGDDSSSIRDKESARHVINNVLTKRNSKIDSLVEKFKETDNSSPNTAPNTAPKPKPKTPVRKYFDSNNNSKADTKESDKTVEEKMTGGIEQKTSEKSSQGIPLGLSVHERAKRLTENLPNMKPENLGGLKNKPGIKPQTSEKPKPPAGTGVYKKFTIPKDKSQAGDFAVELRRKIVDSQDPKKSLHRVSVKSVIRNFDEKKFKIAPRDSVKANEKPPEKPAKLDEEIDWEDLETEYKRITQEKAESSSDHGIKELEEEEFYDDCGNMVPAERISFIEPMTEEEELGDESQWEKHGFTGLGDNEEFPPPPTEILVDGHVQEEYDDVAGPGADKRESGGSELYEPLPDELDEPPPPSPRPGGGEEEPPEPPPQPPPEPPRPPKDSKESEKEKKRKEKEEREKKAREEKEERERKAKEEKEERERKAREEKEEREKKKKLDKEQKELKKLADKFKIPMADLAKSVGQGKIKATVKSSKSHLGVQDGDSVEIIRMNEPNPKGKFLVRLTESQADHVYGTPYDPYDLMGYVDSSNIEVDTGIIRRLMEGSESATSSGPNSGQDEDVIGETYEDVDGQGEGEGEGLIEEDIYEECI